MTVPPSPRLSRRKQPRQARATALVEAVLEAARQVLAEVGPARFTTARVADRAGVSVGSLYQYFPNKAAILFQLQSDEWRDTSALLRGLLEDRTRSPRERLRAMVHAFIRSECEEAAMRGALGEAAPLYRAAPEAETVRETTIRAIEAFLREAVPDVVEARRRVACDLIARTLDAMGEGISEMSADGPMVEAYAEGLADMLDAYLERLEVGSG